MGKKEAFMVALTALLVIGVFFPSTGFCREHFVNVSRNGNGVGGVDVWISVKTGPGDDDWTTEHGVTNGWGDIVVDLAEHSTAVFWFAVLDPMVTPINPASYYQETDYYDVVIEWVIQ